MDGGKMSWLHFVKWPRTIVVSQTRNNYKSVSNKIYINKELDLN